MLCFQLSVIQRWKLQQTNWAVLQPSSPCKCYILGKNLWLRARTKAKLKPKLKVKVVWSNCGRELGRTKSVNENYYKMFIWELPKGLAFLLFLNLASENVLIEICCVFNIYLFRYWDQLSSPNSKTSSPLWSLH